VVLSESQTILFILGKHKNVMFVRIKGLMISQPFKGIASTAKMSSSGLIHISQGGQDRSGARRHNLLQKFL
jgi:hypothetical protein